jgi:hypothetical protein
MALYASIQFASKLKSAFADKVPVRRRMMSGRNFLVMGVKDIENIFIAIRRSGSITISFSQTRAVRGFTYTLYKTFHDNPAPWYLFIIQPNNCCYRIKEAIILLMQYPGFYK